MFDPMIHKLGLKGFLTLPGTPRLKNLIDRAALPPIPNAFCCKIPKPSWGMHLNGPNTYGNKVPAEGLGDCTCAGAANKVETDHAAAQAAGSPGRAFIVPDADVLALYEGAAGYVPGDDSTDQGAYLVQVIQYCMKHGISGNIWRAFAQVNPHDKTSMVEALYLFNGLYMGIWVPDCIEGKDVWDYVPGSKNLGGHAILGISYNYLFKGKVYPLAIVSWNNIYPCTQAFIDHCVGEAYVVAEKAAMLDSGKVITGVDWNTWISQMSLVQYNPPTPNDQG